MQEFWAQACSWVLSGGTGMELMVAYVYLVTIAASGPGAIGSPSPG